MFGDAGAEIERMTGSVKDDMRNVGSRLDGLQVRPGTHVAAWNHA